MIVDIGPTTLLLRAKKEGRDISIERGFIEERVRKVLSDLREDLPVLKHKAYRIRKTKYLSYIGRKMVEAVKTVDSLSLTPMASVAGSISDFLLEEILFYYDPDFVFVNNGGDISVYSKAGEEFRVGLMELGPSEEPSYVFRISGRSYIGIATSGLGGRSFTMGICDSVTVFAEKGSIADAAATYICNSTYLAGVPVERIRAKEVDPLSDLGDEFVVIKRKRLLDENVLKALARGLEVARTMKERNIILDAFLTLEGSYAMTFDDKKTIDLEVIHGGKKDSHSS